MPSKPRFVTWANLFRIALALIAIVAIPWDIHHRIFAPAPNWALIATEPLVLVGWLWCTLGPLGRGAIGLPAAYYSANGREVSARTWALNALVCIVSLGVFFGAVLGKRGPDLIAFVVIPTSSILFVTWLKSRRASRDPRPT